jgi:hypothetical protein
MKHCNIGKLHDFFGPSSAENSRASMTWLLQIRYVCVILVVTTVSNAHIDDAKNEAVEGPHGQVGALLVVCNRLEASNHLRFNVK